MVHLFLKSMTHLEMLHTSLKLPRSVNPLWTVCKKQSPLFFKHHRNFNFLFIKCWNFRGMVYQIGQRTSSKFSHPAWHTHQGRGGGAVPKNKCYFKRLAESFQPRLLDHHLMSWSRYGTSMQSQRRGIRHPRRFPFLPPPPFFLSPEQEMGRLLYKPYQSRLFHHGSK